MEIVHRLGYLKNIYICVTFIGLKYLNQQYELKVKVW